MFGLCFVQKEVSLKFWILTSPGNCYRMPVFLTNTHDHLLPEVSLKSCLSNAAFLNWSCHLNHRTDTMIRLNVFLFFLKKDATNPRCPREFYYI